MPTNQYEAWPFQPPEARHREQAARWWQTCYLPGLAERQLADSRLWAVITGKPRSGKSVALAAWVNREGRSRFIVNYPPERWHGAPHAWFADKADHISHLLAAAGNQLRDWLGANPERAAELSAPSREFLRGLLEWMGGPRMYQLFLRQLPAEIASAYQEAAGLALDDAQYTLWQMEEFAALLRDLGFSRFTFIVDFPTYYTAEQGEQLGNLFGLVDVMLTPPFDIVAAVPEAALHESNLVGQSRGRVNVYYTDWTEEECREIADRHVRAALNAPPETSLATYASAEMLDAVSVLLREEYGYPCPGAWIEMAEVVLYLTLHAPHKLKYPLRLEHLDEVKLRFYPLYMKLRFEPELQGVWRGPRKIKLPPEPFMLLQLLYERKGAAINLWNDPELQELTSNKIGKVYSLFSKVRRKIEPTLAKREKKKKQWVYVLNDSEKDGYWLENFV